MENLSQNLKRILRIQLALESYQDDTNENTGITDKAFNSIAQMRKNKDILSPEEQLIATKEVLKQLDNVLDVIGRDKFIFYEDGDINYIWD